VYVDWLSGAAAQVCKFEILSKIFRIAVKWIQHWRYLDIEMSFIVSNRVI